MSRRVVHNTGSDDQAFDVFVAAAREVLEEQYLEDGMTGREAAVEATKNLDVLTGAWEKGVASLRGSG